MPTTNLTPSGTNTADFRKSFYDDDGDALTVVHAKVIEVDGQPVTGAAQTPSWLVYATSQQATTEGPQGARNYLHFDFSIPLADAALEEGRTYVVDLSVSDGARTASKTFRFYAADFDLDKVSPMALWISARKSTNNSGSETNRAPESTITVVNDSWEPSYIAGFFGEHAAFYNDHMGDANRIRKTTTPLLPNADPTAAVSLFVVVQEVAGSSTGTRTILRQQQNYGSRDWELQFVSGQKLKATKQGDYALTTAADVKAQDQAVLIEYHRKPDGAAEYRVNGAVVLTGTETDGFADNEFQFVSLDTTHYTDLAVYTGELTDDQKTWVRRKYKNLYYDQLAITTGV